MKMKQVFKISFMGFLLLIFSWAGYSALPGNDSIQRPSGFTTGLANNTQETPTGATDITKKFNFTPCSVAGGFVTCHDSLFSEMGNQGSGMTGIKDSPWGHFEIKCDVASTSCIDHTPLLYIGNPDPVLNYTRKAFSLSNYVRLSLFGPGTTQLDFRTIAAGLKLNFKFYESFAVLNGVDVSNAVIAKVEVYKEDGTTLVSPQPTTLTPVCIQPGSYDPNKQSKSLFYPAGVYPILKTCEYRDGSVEIPATTGQEIHIRWTLTADSRFYNLPSGTCRTPDGGAATCSPFIPYVTLSIDDIQFDQVPPTPKLDCNTYEVDVGQSPNCKLTVATSQQLSSLYSLRIKQVSATGQPVTQPNSAINASNFFNFPGNYIVDGICQGTLKNNKKLFCGKTTQQANITVGPPAPLAAFVGRGEVRIVLSENTDPSKQFAGDTPVSVSIFRKGQTAPLGEIPYTQMQAEGFADHNVPDGTMYAYQIRYQSGKQGDVSRWDAVSWDPRTVSLKTQYLPVPGSPMNLWIQVSKGAVPSKGILKLARVPSPDPNRPNALGFADAAKAGTLTLTASGGGYQANQKLYTPVAEITNQNNLFAGLVAWIDPTKDDSQPELKTYYNDPRLPSTMDFLVLAGKDFTEKKWTPKQLQIVLSGMQNVPMMELGQCKFLGTLYDCSSAIPSPITMFRFPAVPADAMKAMIAYHYGELSQQGLSGGFLRCPECRQWLTQQAQAIFGNTIDFRNVDPDRDCSLQRFGEASYQRQCTPQAAATNSWSVAASLATFDAVKMAAVVRDPLKCLTNANCPARARGALYASQNNRYVESFLASLVDNSGTLSPQTAIILAGSNQTTLGYFFRPLFDDYARMAPTDPFRQTVDSMQFVEPANTIGEFAEESWNNVYKPFLQGTVRGASASVKGLFIGVLEMLASFPPCAEGTVMGTAEVEQCQRDKQSLLQKIQKLESRLLASDDFDDPTTLAIYEIYNWLPKAFSIAAPGVGVLNSVRAARLAKVAATVPLRATMPAAAGSETVTIVTGITTDAATGVEISHVATSTQASTQTAKIVGIADAIPASSDAKVKMIETAVKSAAPEIAELKLVASPNSELGQQLQAAAPRGQAALEQAAQCSDPGLAATKINLPKAEVTLKPDNRLRVAYQRLQQRTERPLILHPQGATEVSQYPQVFSDNLSDVARSRFGPNGTYTRVPPGTQFARLDNNFDDLNAAMQHARDIQLVGGPGGTKSYQRALRNHIDNTPECIGNTGGGPRPLGGWVSTILKQNFDRLFSRFVLNAPSNAERYTVVYEGQTGRNTV